MRLPLLAATLVLAACQLPAVPLGEPTESASASAASLGAPGPVPQSLEALVEAGEAEAATWQDDARVAQVEVELDAEGTWLAATATYLAPGADTLLTYSAGPDGTAVQRTTLATLGVPALPAEAVEQVPPLPAGSLGPASLLAEAADAVAECGAAPGVTDVVYATGAPVAWDGDEWTATPEWTATVQGPGGAVVVDPVDGDPVGACLPPTSAGATP